jgi:archaemetzincin
MGVLGAVLGGIMAWQAPSPPSASADRVAPPRSTRPLEAPARDDGPDAYPPLPAPGPGDWLAQHPEPGQSLAAFRAAPRRKVTGERRVLRLLPLEEGARLGIANALLAEHLSIYYGLPAEASGPRAPVRLRRRVNESTLREQILTGDVLDWLRSEITGRDLCVLALTSEDLFPQPSWNFVFGQASLDEGTGVFSFARMDPAFPKPPPPLDQQPPERRALVLRRCLKVVTHETGHMLGLEHCIERLCLMNGSNHLTEMDRQPLHMCPTCLAKVGYATGIGSHAGARARHVGLEAFYRAHALLPEAGWVAARLAPPTR